MLTSQTDIFTWKLVELGNLFKLRVRSDGSGLNSSWLLSRVEVADLSRGSGSSLTSLRETLPEVSQRGVSANGYSVFHCERWLSKSREDRRLERVLYVEGYTGPRDPVSSASMGNMRLSNSSLTSTESGATASSKTGLNVNISTGHFRIPRANYGSGLLPASQSFSQLPLHKLTRADLDKAGFGLKLDQVDEQSECTTISKCFY
ncbi:unnamed protein product [Protopolystoma xenopodis]|uniref:PLAT domain-containing protein n=1 Tax=Protopolystoma xenopodis TaxID=117903 RepID=A0A3S5AMJ0_9PLAT|nr:unnamed protein product [Protopolystoma xenopodis]